MNTEDLDIEMLTMNAKAGWKLNPNPLVVKGITKGLIRCHGHCPCDNDSEDDKCPCSNYRLHDKCCCGLYVKINN